MEILKNPLQHLAGFLAKGASLLFAKLMEEKRIKVQNKSGDKKYFTIIPNYVLNHSTANDQALYMQMKRIAGEDGICYTSQENLMKKLSIGYQAFKKSLDYLLENNWVTFIGTRVTKTSPLNCYEVNDIWELNSKYYQKKITVKTKNSLEKTKEISVPKGDRSRFQKINNNPYNKNIILPNGNIGTSVPFSTSHYLKKLKEHKQRRLQVIEVYWTFRGFEFENKAQIQSALKRELRAAQILRGYSDERLLETMKRLDSSDLTKWTLETVHKYIDEKAKVNKVTKIQDGKIIS